MRRVLARPRGMKPTTVVGEPASLLRDHLRPVARSREAPKSSARPRGGVEAIDKTKRLERPATAGSGGERKNAQIVKAIAAMA